MELTQLNVGNRPRSQRSARGLNVEIVDNDIDGIFVPLALCDFMTARQLAACDRRYITKSRYRLSQLYHATEGHQAHWLRRLSEDPELKPFLPIQIEELYRLGSLAQEFLTVQGSLPNEPWVERAKVGVHKAIPSRVMQLAHDHMAVNDFLDIRMGALAAGEDFKTHIDLVSAAPSAIRETNGNPLRISFVRNGIKRNLIPDAVFGIGSKLYFYEADRASESIKSTIIPKIIDYRYAIEHRLIDKHYGIESPDVYILFNTINQSRMHTVMAHLSEITQRAPRFCFRTDTTYSSFMRLQSPNGDLYSAEWQRVGCEPFKLSE